MTRLFKLIFFRLLQQTLAELQNIRVQPEVDIMGEVAEMMDTGKLPGVETDCTMDPREFYSDIQFYIFKCRSSIKAVNLLLAGTNLYLQGQPVANSLRVDLPHPEEPQVRVINSCPAGVAQPQAGLCKNYRLDVFRVGGDLATLSLLGVSSARLMTLEPNFSPGITEYTTKVTQDTPFAVSATSEQFHSRVGIEFAGDHSMATGLTDQNNGCRKGTRQQQIWELSGFSGIGIYNFVVCALAPDGEHMTQYKLKVEVLPVYSEKLKDLTIDGYSLTPAFDPEIQSYRVEIPHTVMKVPLLVTAHDPEAKITISDDDHKDSISKRGSIESVVHMHDNSDLEEGVPPQWSREVVIQMESADGQKRMSYLVDVQQTVSHFSQLKNISVGNNTCTLTPAFHPNITEYYCTFWWEDYSEAVVIPHMDNQRCDECVLRMPSDTEFPEQHLSLDFELMKKRDWSSGEEWRRKFLYGEFHRIPIQVVSADKFTHTTYIVTAYRDAPWWMRAATSRLISNTATTIAMLMSMQGAANLMALAKQVQFMDLTTEIQGIPDVYSNFAQSLKGFSFDFSAYMPDLGLPTLEDIKEFKKKIVAKVEAAMPMHDSASTTQILIQYCYARTNFGLLAANALLHRHPSDTELMRKQLLATGGNIIPEDALEEKKTKGLEDSSGTKGETHLRGARRMVSNFIEDVGGAPLRSLFLGQRILDDASDEDDAPKDHKYQDVFSWTNHHWEVYKKNALKNGINASDYALFTDKMPCDKKPIDEVVHLLTLFHDLNLLREMLHTYAGSFVLMVGGIVFGGMAYLWYWKTIMEKSQMRLQVLEPGFLWLFILDYALIGFMKNASKVLVKSCIITFFFYTPSRWMVQLTCIIGIIVYPVLFTIAISYATMYLIRNSKLIFNNSVGSWIDPACHEMKVTLEPNIPRYIPVLPGILTSHVRCCIPILNSDGKAIVFEEHQKKADHSSKQKHLSAEAEKDALAMEDDLQKEIDELAVECNLLGEYRKKRELRLKAEQENLSKKARTSNHTKELQRKCEKAEEEAKAYESKLQTPAWFSKETKHVRVAETVSSLKAVKHRHQNERLDAEENFALMQYIEAFIRREGEC